MAFIQNYTTGIMCAVISSEKAIRLGLPPMVKNNTDNHQTAFTVSCDSDDTSTGVSAEDRNRTLKAIYNENVKLRKPGHIFPLVANPGGLSVRRGHTEASYDLNRICFKDNHNSEVSLICELVNNNGVMMRYPSARKLAKLYNIPIIHINQIKEVGDAIGLYKTAVSVDTSIITKLATCNLKTSYGDWSLMAFSSELGAEPNRVLVMDKSTNKPLVRIHSECFTGDVLSSKHCDCGAQLKWSMNEIFKNGNGVIIFPSGHEGRGIGFTEKIKAYDIIQTKKVDTTWA